MRFSQVCEECPCFQIRCGIFLNLHPKYGGVKHPIMDIRDAQRDMRDAYYGGWTGALVSGLVWVSAGLTALYGTQMTALIVFLIGGMMIFPISTVLDKLLGRSGKHAKGNPLGQLALESTVMMLLGILIALAVYTKEPLWFFPVMLLIIAGRYLTFATIYGMKLYWVLAAALAGAGYLIFSQGLAFYLGGLLGGAIEIVFSFLLMASSRKNQV